MSDWHDRDAYEVAYVDGEWLVLVRGGAYATGEPTFHVQARCPDREDAIRVRDALRVTLPAEGAE